MSRMLNMLSLEGSLERKETSTYMVTIWYIPDSIHHHQAKAVDVFFDDVHTARVFEQKWIAPPESAIMVSLSEIDLTKMQIESAFNLA